MLTLVHPARDGQDPPKRRPPRASSLNLTSDEERQLRTVIRNVTPRHGALTQLAARLGVSPKALSPSRRLTPGLALALARDLRLSVDAMLSGKLTRVGKCPACGAKTAEVAS
jgi:hypothetical protein